MDPAKARIQLLGSYNNPPHYSPEMQQAMIRIQATFAFAALKLETEVTAFKHDKERFTQALDLLQQAQDVISVSLTLPLMENRVDQRHREMLNRFPRKDRSRLSCWAEAGKMDRNSYPDCNLRVASSDSDSSVQSILGHRVVLARLPYFQSLFQQTSPEEIQQYDHQYHGVYDIDVPFRIETVSFLIDCLYDDDKRCKTNRCHADDLLQACLFFGADPSPYLISILRKILMDKDKTEVENRLSDFLQLLLKCDVDSVTKRNVLLRTIHHLSDEQKQSLDLSSLKDPPSDASSGSECKHEYKDGSKDDPSADGSDNGDASITDLMSRAFAVVPSANQSRIVLAGQGRSRCKVEWQGLVFHSYVTADIFTHDSMGFWVSCHPLGEVLGRWDLHQKGIPGEISTTVRKAKLSLLLYHPTEGIIRMQPRYWKMIGGNGDDDRDEEEEGQDGLLAFPTPIKDEGYSYQRDRYGGILENPSDEDIMGYQFVIEFAS